MTPSLSPLRYPGGKGFLARFFAEVFHANGLKDALYVEPFAGGAGAALRLLDQGYVSEIFLNDLNYAVFSFWRSAINQSDEFCRLIEKARLDIREYHRQKAVLASPRQYTRLQVGFAAFYVNRTNRSGILNGGPIGGYDQKGPWKLTARFPKTELIDRILKVASYSTRIHTTNEDALNFLSKFHRERSSIKERVVVYLDPPYISNGRRLYLNSYVREDHEKLARFLKRLRTWNWLLTYDRVPEI